MAQNRKLTKKTKAILGVHLFGQCCKMERLVSLGLPVIEDAAQAIGATRNNRPAGSLGVAGCFSFFPTKNAGAYGDGGMITTDDESLANRIRSVRAHGERGQKYIHESLGTNSRLDELQAAVLRVKLRHLEEWTGKRRKNAEYYWKSLEGLPLQLPVIDDRNSSNYHQFVIQSEKRDDLKHYLASKGIATAIYYPRALPLQPCFAYLGNQSGDFPAAEASAARSLALPIYPELTESQLDFVSATVRSFY